LHMVDRLQLLNLQHNRIASIQHLAHLQSLVLLNLSHNSLCGMAGLEHLRSLRVLLLGRNRIQEMSCLDQLQKLHILDLHDNQICRIQNVSHLSELRVLNLAGNLISSLENLQGLEQLRELHLQHNRLSALESGDNEGRLSLLGRGNQAIRTFQEVDCLPSLQRLFLSCNNISSSWDQVAGLGNLPSLCELALDGNPVALETWYKQAVLRCLLRLQQLDMKRVTV
uniref:Uncharacterized protein n=1 Tax=Tetraodon nigroviridis TaxID=99883 RepID=H3C5J8_TETNG